MTDVSGLTLLQFLLQVVVYDLSINKYEPICEQFGMSFVIFYNILNLIKILNFSMSVIRFAIDININMFYLDVTIWDSFHLLSAITGSLQMLSSLFY